MFHINASVTNRGNYVLRWRGVVVVGVHGNSVLRLRISVYLKLLQKVKSTNQKINFTHFYTFINMTTRKIKIASVADI